METFLADISKNYPWIIPIAIFILLVMAIVKDPSIISEISKLARRTSKDPQPEEVFGNFALIKLKRLSHFSWKVEGIFGIVQVILFGISIFYFILIFTIIPIATSAWIRLFWYLCFMVFSFVWIDMLVYKNTIIKMKFNCDPTKLFVYCYKYLLNSHLTITEFDLETRTITAWLGDVELKIRINVVECQRVEIETGAKRSLLGILFYTSRYVKFFDAFIYHLCYPKN